jgi:hypothetical protein
VKGIQPRLFPHASRFKSSVAFCYRVKKKTVAGHPRLKSEEPMADGLWSDKRDKVFVSTELLAISPQPGSDGTGLADNRE